MSVYRRFRSTLAQSLLLLWFWTMLALYFSFASTATQRTRARPRTDSEGRIPPAPLRPLLGHCMAAGPPPPHRLFIMMAEGGGLGQGAVERVCCGCTRAALTGWVAGVHTPACATLQRCGAMAPRSRCVCSKGNGGGSMWARAYVHDTAILHTCEARHHAGGHDSMRAGRRRVFRSSGRLSEFPASGPVSPSRSDIMGARSVGALTPRRRYVIVMRRAGTAPPTRATHTVRTTHLRGTASAPVLSIIYSAALEHQGLDTHHHHAAGVTLKVATMARAAVLLRSAVLLLLGFGGVLVSCHLLSDGKTATGGLEVRRLCDDRRLFSGVWGATAPAACRSPRPSPRPSWRR